MIDDALGPRNVLAESVVELYDRDDFRATVWAHSPYMPHGSAKGGAAHPAAPPPDSWELLAAGVKAYAEDPAMAAADKGTAAKMVLGEARGGYRSRADMGLMYGLTLDMDTPQGVNGAETLGRVRALLHEWGCAYFAQSRTRDADGHTKAHVHIRLSEPVPAAEYALWAPVVLEDFDRALGGAGVDLSLGRPEQCVYLYHPVPGASRVETDLSGVRLPHGIELEDFAGRAKAPAGGAWPAGEGPTGATDVSPMGGQEARALWRKAVGDVGAGRGTQELLRALSDARVRDPSVRALEEIETWSRRELVSPHRKQAVWQAVNGLARARRDLTADGVHAALYRGVVALGNAAGKRQWAPGEVPNVAEIYAKCVATWNGKEAAEVKADADRMGDWSALLSRDAANQIRPTLGNLVVALRCHPDMRGVFAYDVFTDRPIVAPGRVLPWEDPSKARVADRGLGRALEENEVSWGAAMWFARMLDDIGPDAEPRAASLLPLRVAKEAVYSVVEGNRIDAGEMWGAAAAERWDGVRRLDTWIETFFVPETEEDLAAARTYGRRWFIGAAARLMGGAQGPVKNDAALLLVGPQGIGKSSVLSSLVPEPSAFIEGLIVTKDGISKDSMIRTRGAMIVAYDELGEMSRGQKAALKAHMTLDTDVYRAPYARQRTTHVRRYAQASTADTKEVLEDSQGSRRWWPVGVSARAPGALTLEHTREALAPLLWGEAVHAWRGGEVHWLTVAEDMVRDAHAGEEFTKTTTASAAAAGVSQSFIRAMSTLEPARAKIGWSSENRIRFQDYAATLRRLGWRRVRMRVSGGRGYRWLPSPEAIEAVPDIPGPHLVS
jgi:hypothetical protein